MYWVYCIILLFLYLWRHDFMINDRACVWFRALWKIKKKSYFLIVRLSQIMYLKSQKYTVGHLFMYYKIQLSEFIFNPCNFSWGFFPNIFLFLRGVVATPLWIINTEGHITLNLLPVYRYGHPLSIDTKISTNHYCMTSLWRHYVSAPTKIEKWPFCV